MSYQLPPLFPEALAFFSYPSPGTQTFPPLAPALHTSPPLAAAVPKTPLPKMNPPAVALPSLSALKGKFSLKPPTKRKRPKAPVKVKAPVKSPVIFTFGPTITPAAASKAYSKRHWVHVKDPFSATSAKHLRTPNLEAFLQSEPFTGRELKALSSILANLKPRTRDCISPSPRPENVLEKLLIDLLREFLAAPSHENEFNQHFVNLTKLLLNGKQISPHFSTNLANLMILTHSQSVFDKNFCQQIEPLISIFSTNFVYLDEKDKQQLVAHPALCLLFFKNFYSHLSNKFSYNDLDSLLQKTLIYISNHPNQAGKLIKSNLFLFLNATLNALECL